MVGAGKLIGIILILAGLAVAFLAGAYLFSGYAAGKLSLPAAILGFSIATIVMTLPAAGVGIYLLTKGRAEEAQFAQLEKERKILNMVLAQGKVRFAEVALELNTSREEVEDLVRSLVGKNLFSGAINWRDGILYSKELSQFNLDRKCPNCGGELEIVGKGVIKCPWCGSEVFLHRDFTTEPPAN